MKVRLISIVKAILNFLGIFLTRNQYYDAAAQRIYRQLIRDGANCIDIGCHKGEILDQFLHYSPGGTHFAFEPIPVLYEGLKQKYGRHSNVHLYPNALAREDGTTVFQYVTNAPAYSGLRKRKYDIANPEIIPISIEKKRLDDVIPLNLPISLIKIDVEGAEYEVFMGGVKLISQNRPHILFEFGLGAADYYNVTPAAMYALLCETLKLKIYTLKGWLHKEAPLNLEELEYLYGNNKEYYFLASPD